MDIKMILAAILVPIVCGIAATVIISRVQARRKGNTAQVQREDSDL